MKIGLRLLVGGILCAAPIASFADCPATIKTIKLEGNYLFHSPSGWKQYTNGITAIGTGKLLMVSLSSSDVRTSSSLTNIQIKQIGYHVPSCTYGVNVDAQGVAQGGFFSITPKNPSFTTNLSGSWDYQNPVQSYVCEQGACQFSMQ